MKINTVIIEDEKNNVDIITHFLTKYCPTINILGHAANVVDGVTLIEKSNPDLIFMDIMLEKGTGFDILDKIKNTTAKIIFVTAYNEFAIKAFKYSAMDYLLKPLQISELKNAVAKVEQNISNVNQNKQLDILIQQLSSTKYEDKFIAIPMLNKIEIIPINEILYIEADGKYSNFVLCNKSVLSSKNIGEYEKNLLIYPNFSRIHHSYIANLNFIKSINKIDGISCKMKNDVSIPVSRRKKDELYKMLKI